MGSLPRPSRLFRGEGQSTLEYFLVLIAIIAAVTAAANAVVRPAIEKMLGESSAVIQNSAGKVRAKLGL